MGKYTVVDEQIIELARKQHGVVSRHQLAQLELSAKALRVRVENRRLASVCGARVYKVCGWPPTVEQDLLAAVLACGPTAFASHSSAAALSQLDVPLQARPEVTVILERCPAVEGIRLHRSGLLIERDVTELAGIPVTTPERTLVDLSGRLDERKLYSIARDATDRRITNVARINSCVERLGSAPGRSAKKMRAVVARLADGGAETESVLEDFVYDAIRRFGLPLPVCQYEVEIGGRRYRIDMCYVEKKIALEVDGFDPHRGRKPFDNDRFRRNDVVLTGFTVLQFTSAFTDWQIAATVATALDLPVPPPPVRQLTFNEWTRVCSDPAL